MADPRDLATLADVKAWLGPDVGTASDALLQSLITRASVWITDYLNRLILSASYTETVSGNGKDYMLLGNYPITAVASIAFQGSTITVAANPLTLSSGYMFDGRKLSLIGYCFPRGLPIVIAYTAGYASSPPDIVQACCELVGEAFYRRQRIGIASKQLGGQETISFSQKDMNDATRLMLANYRNVVPL